MRKNINLVKVKTRKWSKCTTQKGWKEEVCKLRWILRNVWTLILGCREGKVWRRVKSHSQPFYTLLKMFQSLIFPSHTMFHKEPNSYYAKRWSWLNSWTIQQFWKWSNKHWNVRIRLMATIEPRKRNAEINP